MHIGNHAHMQQCTDATLFVFESELYRIPDNRMYFCRNIFIFLFHSFLAYICILSCRLRICNNIFKIHNIRFFYELFISIIFIINNYDNTNSFYHILILISDL